MFCICEKILTQRRKTELNLNKKLRCKKIKYFQIKKVKKIAT